jgi:SOS response regulatory protein OraA/RecX
MSAAMRLLGRRPLTEAELRARLAKARHSATAIDHTCERLRAAGYLDDHALALDFIVNRAQRLGHGPEKLVAALCGRGVLRDVAEGALQLTVERGDFSPREVLLQRMRHHLRVAAPPLGRRDYARVYNALRRAGFGEEMIRQELDCHREPASHAEPIANETTDDFP